MWPAVALMLAGAVVKHKNNQDAYSRQNYFRQQLENYQRQKSAEGLAATQAYLDKQTPDKRAAELADLTKTRSQSLQDTVNATGAVAQRPELAGRVSADFGKSQDAAAARVADRTKRAIEQLATMGAPGDQGIQHGIRFGRAAGKVDAANIGAANVGNDYMLDMNNVRPNPRTDLLSNMMTVGGAATLGGWPGAAAAGAVAACKNDAGGGDTMDANSPYNRYRTRLNSGYWTSR